MPQLSAEHQDQLRASSLATARLLHLVVRPLLFCRERSFCSRADGVEAEGRIKSLSSAICLGTDAQAAEMSTLGVGGRGIDALIPLLQLLAPAVKESDDQSDTGLLEGFSPRRIGV